MKHTIPRLSHSPHYLVCALALSFLWAFGALACDPKPLDEINRATREQAVSIAIGSDIVGNIDTRRQPNAWKTFTIDRTGVLNVNIRFDNHDANGEAILTDAQGRALSTFQDKKRDLLKNITIKVEPGIYYLNIQTSFEEGNATDIDTNYTLQLAFKAI